MGDPAAWWRDGVLYQIYTRSSADSNADGIGDLRGVIAHLDYLQWLGIDGIWLTPITVSLDRDFGYDVADYCRVQPAFGDLGSADELIAEAGRRGIRVILDLVPNHTSDQHPWFLDARESRHSRHRDWYVWADPRPDGGLPNNWLSAFGGPAWSLDERTGQYYLHQFLPEQPDLVEPGRARCLRRHSSFLVRPRRGRLSDRCRECDRQGSPAAGQPPGHRPGPSYNLQH